jgi:hypothetical protein
MLEPFGIETGTIIPNAQSECLVAKHQLGLNGARVCVLNRVSECLLRNPISLVAHERHERTSLPFENYPECDRLRCGGILRE